MQTASPTTPHCRRLSPRWPAMWARTPPRTATSPPRTAISLPANGGNCSNRGATRRRHADRMLLMVQKPPLCLGGGGVGARGAAARPAVWARRPSCPDMAGGNCTIRGATRRQDAPNGAKPPSLPLVSCSLTVRRCPGQARLGVGGGGIGGMPRDDGLSAPRQRLEGVAGNDGRCHGWPAPR